MIHENFKKWNRITVEELSHVSSEPAAIPSSRFVLSRDKRLPLDTWNTSGPEEFFLVINVFCLIHSEIILKEFIILQQKGATGSIPVHMWYRRFWSNRWRSKWGHNFNADVCKKAVDYEFIISGGNSTELYGWTAKTANIGTAF